MELLLISLKNMCYVETKFWDKINQIIGHTALISWDWNTSSTSELSVVQLSASCASKNKVVRMNEGNKNSNLYRRDLWDWCKILTN